MRLPKQNTRLLLVCLAMWGSMLAVGLWPFNFFPKNKVRWLGDKNGVRFEWHGQIYSTSPWKQFGPSSALSQDSHTIEIWLGPVDKGKWGDILSMYDPGRQGNLTIAQSLSDLVLRARFRDHDRVILRKFYVDDVFREHKTRFVTVTSDSEGTVVYLEATREKLYPGLTLTADNFYGRLLLGHSPEDRRPWAGEVLGLAIYNRALTAEEVSQHYSAWSQERFSELTRERGAIALYFFDEHTGDLAHNHAADGPDLLIPRRFYILHRSFLVRPSGFDRSDLRDFAINIFGFVPFGLFVSAYLQRAVRLSRSGTVLLTIILGMFTSVTIEVLQAYLPSRDSNLTDLINNSLGMALGAMLGIQHSKWRTHRLP
jgi:hypothetical protein